MPPPPAPEKFPVTSTPLSVRLPSRLKIPPPGPWTLPPETVTLQRQASAGRTVDLEDPEPRAVARDRRSVPVHGDRCEDQRQPVAAVGRVVRGDQRVRELLARLI
jgi:hypothetical protein